MKYTLYTSLAVIITLLTLVIWFSLDLEHLPSDGEEFFAQVKTWVQARGFWAPVAFIILLTLLTIFLFWLPVWPMTVLAGALFGLWWGTLYSVIGATLGAIGAFLLTRYLEGGRLQHWLDRRLPRLGSAYGTLGHHGLFVVFTARLIPILPFRGLNYAFGTTTMSLKDFTIGTALGIIPGTFVFAYLGASLASLRPIHIIAAILLAVAFSGLIYWYQRSTLSRRCTN